MTLVLTVFALVGLVLLAVGAILFLVRKPVHPTTPMVMVIGALIFAVAQIVLYLDALF